MKNIVCILLALFMIGLVSCVKSNNISQTSQQPIKILSVRGPLEPINPGGPIVEITLENTSAQNIISLNATLRLTKEFNFEFDVSSSKPLLPGKSISSRLTLIGGGFNTYTSYPLKIKGEIEDGTTFDYTEQVQIIVPE